MITEVLREKKKQINIYGNINKTAIKYVFSNTMCFTIVISSEYKYIKSVRSEAYGCIWPTLYE